MGLISFLIYFFKNCECKPIFEVPECTIVYEAQDESEDAEISEYSDTYYNIYVNRLPDDF
tara:strand:- start:723 stop:902 length:180 start_codon:yes stop_codon:yes gene_type:complete